MTHVLMNVGWAISFIMIGALIGTILMLFVATVVPKIIDKSTPHIDEAKEILRGNVAVAQYSGRIASATIIGVSIIIAASVLAGIIAALHG